MQRRLIKTDPYGEQEESGIASAAVAVNILQTMYSPYYDPSESSSFSSRRKLQTASLERGHPTSKTGHWLLQQDAYTLYRPARILRSG